jgi:hypothetical protein
MRKIALAKLFTFAFAVSVVPLFFFIRYGGQHGSFDSLGLWYTIYGAVVIALLFGAVVIAVVGTIRAFAMRSRSNSEPTDA